MYYSPQAKERLTNTYSDGALCFNVDIIAIGGSPFLNLHLGRAKGAAGRKIGGATSKGYCTRNRRTFFGAAVGSRTHVARQCGCRTTVVFSCHIPPISTQLKVPRKRDVEGCRGTRYIDYAMGVLG